VKTLPFIVRNQLQGVEPSNVLYSVHNSPPLVSILNSIHNFPPYFDKVHSNNIYPSMTMSSKWPSPCRFSKQNIARISHTFPCVLHAPSIPSSLTRSP